MCRASAASCPACSITRAFCRKPNGSSVGQGDLPVAACLRRRLSLGRVAVARLRSSPIDPAARMWGVMYQRPPREDRERGKGREVAREEAERERERQRGSRERVRVQNNGPPGRRGADVARRQTCPRPSPRLPVRGSLSRRSAQQCRKTNLRGLLPWRWGCGLHRPNKCQRRPTCTHASPPSRLPTRATRAQSKDLVNRPRTAARTPARRMRSPAGQAHRPQVTTRNKTGRGP